MMMSDVEELSSWPVRRLEALKESTANAIVMLAIVTAGKYHFRQLAVMECLNDHRKEVAFNGFRCECCNKFRLVSTDRFKRQRAEVAGRLSANHSCHSTENFVRDGALIYILAHTFTLRVFACSRSSFSSSCLLSHLTRVSILPLTDPLYPCFFKSFLSFHVYPWNRPSRSQSEMSELFPSRSYLSPLLSLAAAHLNLLITSCFFNKRLAIASPASPDSLPRQNRP